MGRGEETYTIRYNENKYKGKFIIRHGAHRLPIITILFLIKKNFNTSIILSIKKNLSDLFNILEKTPTASGLV